MKQISLVRVTIALLALPVMMTVAIFKAIHTVWASRYGLAGKMACRHCGGSIRLVRAWRCPCGFTYVGSVLRLCPVCGARPLMVRCDQCGMTWRIR